MGQFADASRSYSRAVELDASHADGLIGLAQAQFSEGNVKEATASLDSGIKRFPKEARLKVLYASVLQKEAETSGSQVDHRAEEMLRSALVLDHSLPSAHYELGKLELNAGRLPEALEHLEKAAKLGPQNSETHFALSRAYRRIGRKEEATQQMDIYEKLKKAETQTSSSEQATQN